MAATRVMRLDSELSTSMFYSKVAGFEVDWQVGGITSTRTKGLQVQSVIFIGLHYVKSSSQTPSMKFVD